MSMISRINLLWRNDAVTDAVLFNDLLAFAYVEFITKLFDQNLSIVTLPDKSNISSILQQQIYYVAFLIP